MCSVYFNYSKYTCFARVNMKFLWPGIFVFHFSSFSCLSLISRSWWQFLFNPLMITFSSFVIASSVLLYIVRQSVNQSKCVLFQSKYNEGCSVRISSLESFLFPLWYHCYEEALRYLCWMVSRSRRGPRHVGATGTPIIWLPFKPIFCKLLRN